MDRGVHPEPVVVDPARAHVQQPLRAPLLEERRVLRGARVALLGRARVVGDLRLHIRGLGLGLGLGVGLGLGNACLRSCIQKESSRGPCELPAMTKTRAPYGTALTCTHPRRGGEGQGRGKDPGGVRVWSG